jgi:hypothetical protein
VCGNGDRGDLYVPGVFQLTRQRADVVSRLVVVVFNFAV